jgi:hypothetical protein
VPARCHREKNRAWQLKYHFSTRIKPRGKKGMARRTKRNTIKHVLSALTIVLTAQSQAQPITINIYTTPTPDAFNPIIAQVRDTSPSQCVDGNKKDCYGQEISHDRKGITATKAKDPTELMSVRLTCPEKGILHILSSGRFEATKSEKGVTVYYDVVGADPILPEDTNAVHAITLEKVPDSEVASGTNAEFFVSNKEYCTRAGRSHTLNLLAYIVGDNSPAVDALLMRFDVTFMQNELPLDIVP